MTAYFADTFFFLALFDRTDQHHQKVAAWVSAESSGRITTTRWVLAETANALAASKYRVTVAEFKGLRLLVDGAVQYRLPNV